MSTNIFDVAKYILGEVGEVSTMKLQKLCYYSNVKWIVKTKKPMFQEYFEAWANGPVCRDLFAVHKGHFSVSSGMIPNKLLSNDLDDDKKTTINEVLEEYGMMTGAELSAKTHKEKPWIDARGDLPPTAPSTKRITLKSIKAFYA